VTQATGPAPSISLITVELLSYRQHTHHLTMMSPNGTLKYHLISLIIFLLCLEHKSSSIFNYWTFWSLTVVLHFQCYFKLSSAALSWLVSCLYRSVLEIAFVKIFFKLTNQINILISAVAEKKASDESVRWKIKTNLTFVPYFVSSF
jgi:hypothetical protein